MCIRDRAYRGIDIHELADHSTFEETCYLLWFGHLPKPAELTNLQERLAQERHLDPAILSLLRSAPNSCLLYTSPYTKSGPRTIAGAR